MNAQRPQRCTDAETASATTRGVRRLVSLGLASWGLYAVVAQLSARFSYGTPGTERPIPLLLLLFTLLLILYLVALRIAVRNQRVWPVILTFAAAFRILLLVTEPILEIDVYRYVWDGHVVVSGINPYRYSPSEVLAAGADLPHVSDEPDTVWLLPDDLQHLAGAVENDAATATILSRIHYADLTTVYPPVSQVVFATATLTTPGGAGVVTRLVVMKAWMVVFDLLTLLVLARILRDVGQPVGWSLAWGWCPLVIKEFANSGHLDAIAVCLTLTAVWFGVRGLFPDGRTRTATGGPSRRAVGWFAAAAVVLALATGAKLYPVVLVPLLFTAGARRIGWRSAVVCATLYAVVSGLLLYPMLATGPASATTLSMAGPDQRGQVAHDSSAPGPYVTIPPPVPDSDDRDFTDASRRQPPGQGLHAFLSRWKMNDFLFLILETNLRPAGGTTEPWFAITPDSWRKSMVEPLTTATGLTVSAASFALTRAVTAIVFLLLALRWAWRASASGKPRAWLGATFLTLAWFWLLAPTQNPWYWTWALPLVPFARSRAWLFVSGLVMLYYLRFWFIAHWPDTPVGHTPYNGVEFFNYVVVWLEYGPWFFILATEALWRGISTRRSTGDASPSLETVSRNTDARDATAEHGRDADG